MLASRLVCLGLVLGWLTSLSLRAAPPPVDDFLRLPAVSHVRISEAGRYVTFLTPGKDEGYDLNVYDLEKKVAKKFEFGGDEVLAYEWIDATRVIVSTRNLPRYHYRQQVFDIAQDKFTANLTVMGQYFELISSLRRDPDFFVARFEEAEGLYTGASRGLAIINTRLKPKMTSGQNNVRFNVQEWIETPPGEYHGCAVDSEGEVRAVALYHEGRLRWHYRRSPAEAWRELPFDFEKTSLLGFTNDPDAIYVAHLAEGATATTLHLYHVAQNDFGPALADDVEYSMAGARLIGVRRPDRQVRVLGVTYDRSSRVQLALDPVMEEVMAVVSRKIPDRMNFIEDSDYDLRHFVISSSNGREPPRYVVFDRTTQDFFPLPAPAPWFDPATMSVMQSVKFTARDGLVLEGYLSLPAKRSDGTKPPLIVMPHGGPAVRDTWGYDPETQFLTSRGYAVFQPNYRGSSGYARKVSFDPSFDYLAMHRDVTDGVRQLAASGLIDAQRIAIYGGSFGGYLAVCGAAFEPGLYRCAVSFAGVFDWKQMLRQHWGRTWGNKFTYAYLREKLGDPNQQEEHFNAISPLRQVAAIKIPLLVSHGKLDGRVDYEQSRRLLSELKQHHVPHETLIFDTEFHGFYKRDNRRKFLVALEKFLAEHL